MGRLTDDPKFEEKNDIKIARYILAINQGKDRTAIFIPCTAYGNNAEITNKYLSKGSLVAITGKLNSYIDKNDCHKLNVIINHQYFFGDASAKFPSSPEGYLNFEDIDESELPFQ